MVNVYCTLITHTVVYEYVVFSNLPRYLYNLIENNQKRALRIIYPNLPYSEVLEETNLLSLNDRRENSCEKFVNGICPGNPIFPLIHRRSVSFTTLYSLRSGKVKCYIRINAFIYCLETAFQNNAKQGCGHISESLNNVFKFSVCQN